jgi:hypothetical protein
MLLNKISIAHATQSAMSSHWHVVDGLYASANVAGEISSGARLLVLCTTTRVRLPLRHWRGGAGDTNSISERIA